MWHGYHFGGGLWMLGLGIIFWGSIIALIVWAVRRGSGDRGDGGPSSGRKGPIDYLKERYARGEIDREEYERIKKHLEED